MRVDRPLPLNNKVSAELDELLYPFFQDCEGQPLEAVEPPPDDDLLPPWAVGLLFIFMAIACGCLCAFIW